MGKHRPLSGDSFLHEMNTRRTFGNSAGFTDLGNIPMLSLIQFNFIFWVAWIQLDMSSRVVNQICACILGLSELNSEGISLTSHNCHWLLLQITLHSDWNTSISTSTQEYSFSPATNVIKDFIFFQCVCGGGGIETLRSSVESHFFYASSFSNFLKSSYCEKSDGIFPAFLLWAIYLNYTNEIAPLSS